MDEPEPPVMDTVEALNEALKLSDDFIGKLVDKINEYGDALPPRFRKECRDLFSRWKAEQVEFRGSPNDN